MREDFTWIVHDLGLKNFVSIKPFVKKEPYASKLSFVVITLFYLFDKRIRYPVMIKDATGKVLGSSPVKRYYMSLQPLVLAAPLQKCWDI